MIVFDRLAPIDERNGNTMADFTGQYQFYVPETNIVDAFVFDNGRWVLTKDIDARNPQTPKKKKNPYSEKKKTKKKDLKKPENEDPDKAE